MVFSSVPVYLDPPSWNQQQQQQSHQPGSSGLGGGAEAHQLQPAMVSRAEGGGMAGSIRPGSMADRARLAKVPQPEPALKCPRCDSTNTKFCYFNNYSLSQPRHFCKTCRRYWTRGGALRNVPVGGGCRRTKRSKSTGSSKSPMNPTSAAGTGSAAAGVASSAGGSQIQTALQPHMPFMPSLHSLADYGAAASLGLNFGGMQPIDAPDYHVGSSSSVGFEQWRLPQQVHQFPFFAGLEQSSALPQLGLYQFDGDMGVDGAAYAGHGHGKQSTSGLITQMASVKMEENPQALNLPRQYLSMPGNDQFWGGGVGGGAGGGSNGGGGGWTDLSGFNSSSTGNIL